MSTRKEILHKFPFIRLGVPLILGITAGMAGNRPFLPSVSWLVIPLFFIASLPRLTKSFFTYRTRWITGMIINIVLFIFSYEITALRQDHSGRHKSLLSDGNQWTCSLRIIEPVIRKKKSVRIVASISGFREGHRWNRSTDKILLFIEKDENSNRLFYGDRLLFRGVISKPEVCSIPGNFDAGKYLMSKGIYLTAYISKSHWKSLPFSCSNPVFQTALRWREHLLAILQRLKPGDRESGVSSALLLGYVDDIGSDLMKDYSAAGVIHVLSVSGMHVGMVFLVLDKLLFFMERRKGGKLIKSFLCVVFIWIYALMTGLSPAVLRAAAMLTLFITGKCMQRAPESLNILAASFFFLLILDPVMLRDIGFQLSYLALTGIILLYQPIYNLISFGNWLADKIWSLIAVSVAAQLATTPVSLYYFHQFPNLFLVANILIVPLSNLVIYSGILALATGTVPVFSGITATLLGWLVKAMNSIIHFIGSVPGSVTKGIHFGSEELLLLYLILICLLVFLGSKKKTWLFAGLVSLILLQAVSFTRKINRLMTNHFYVYKAGRNAACDLVSGSSAFLIGGPHCFDNPFFCDELQKCHEALRITTGYRLMNTPAYGAEKEVWIERKFFRKGKFFQVGGKKFGILDRRLPARAVHRIMLDYLILFGNPRISLSSALKFYNPGKIIIDNTNSLNRSRKWLSEARKLGIECHAVPVEGAYAEDF